MPLKDIIRLQGSFIHHLTTPELLNEIPFHLHHRAEQFAQPEEWSCSVVRLEGQQTLLYIFCSQFWLPLTRLAMGRLPAKNTQF